MRLPLLIFISGLCVSLSAQNFRSAENTFNRLDTIDMPSSRLAESTFDSNPALKDRQYGFSVTDVRVFHSSDSRETGSYFPWQGNGTMTTGGAVKAYIKVNPRLTAYGDASFRTSHQWKVRWNSAIDYMRIAPYILADSVGGNVSSQQYRFSGGVSYSLGRWAIGGEASYRAEIAYRDRDPRIKDVVSDLNFRFGASYSFGSWITGGTFGVSVYNQEDDVDFYNPVNNIRTYFMTGLGSVYPRFSNGGTGTSAYEGTGLYGSLQLIQNSDKGLKLSVSGGKEEITQRIREFNNLNLTSSETYNIGTSVIYSLPRIFSFHINGYWLRRIGTENIFGTSIGNSYPKLSSRQNYVADNAGGKFSMPVEMDFGSKWRISIVPSFGGSYFREFLREPNRLSEFSYLTPGIETSFIWRSSECIRWNLSLKGDRTISHCIANRLTGLTAETERGEITYLQNTILSSCRTSFDSSLRCDFKIKGMPALFLKGNCHLTSFSKTDADSDGFEISIGSTF